MNKLKALTLAALLLVLTLSARAQQKIDPDQRYLLLATTKTSTMQKELDEAAAQGFRVRVGSPTSGAEMVLLLERAAKPPDTYRYKLLATARTSTMEKELNEAAEGGFRLLPQTMIAKQQVFGAQEIVVLLERSGMSTSCLLQAGHLRCKRRLQKLKLPGSLWSEWSVAASTWSSWNARRKRDSEFAGFAYQKIRRASKIGPLLFYENCQKLASTPRLLKNE
jgi:hypothetical protein